MKLSYRSVFQLFHNPDEYVMVMDQGCGKVVGPPAAPRLRALGQFLRSNVNYCPVLPSKGQERTGVQSKRLSVGRIRTCRPLEYLNVPSSEIEADSSTDRGKTSKLLSPQVDTIRINVRRAVKDSLYAR